LAEVARWMLVKPDAGNLLLGETAEAAANLKFVRRDDQDELHLVLAQDDAASAATDWGSFTDTVHAEMLADVGGNRELLAAAAVLAAAEELDAPPTAGHRNQDDFSLWMRDRLASMGAGTFSKTRLPAWRTWCEHLGLGLAPPEGQEGARARAALGEFRISPASRVERELRTALPEGIEVTAETVRAALHSRLPYLAGSPASLWSDACRAVNATLSGRLGRCLSGALRSLQARGAVELLSARGDEQGALNLFLDNRQPGAIRALVLKAQTEAHR
jgi:hypothetical protein